MTKYSYNKNFIPSSFVKRYKERTRKKNTMLLIVISIIELILFPRTISFIITSNISQKKESEEKIIKDYVVNDESFFEWMDIIKDDTVGTFNNNNAVILFDNMYEFRKLLNNKRLKVTSMEVVDDKYRAQIVIS